MSSKDRPGEAADRAADVVDGDPDPLWQALASHWRWEAELDRREAAARKGRKGGRS